MSLGQGSGSSGTGQQLQIHVQDLKNKLGAARIEVPPVKHLAVEWGMLVAVLQDGGVLRFKVDTASAVRCYVIF
jgi:hypothetical protein